MNFKQHLSIYHRGSPSAWVTLQHAADKLRVVTRKSIERIEVFINDGAPRSLRTKFITLTSDFIMVRSSQILHMVLFLLFVLYYIFESTLYAQTSTDNSLGVGDVVSIINECHLDSNGDARSCFAKELGRSIRGECFGDESSGSVPIPMYGLGYGVRLDCQQSAGNGKRIFVLVFVSKAEAEAVRYKQKTKFNGTIANVVTNRLRYIVLVHKGSIE